MVKDNRKIAAILAADVVGYSRLMGADEEGTLAALHALRGRFDELVREFDGHGFGCVGDSLMAEFPSAVNALRCAMALQARTTEDVAALPPDRRMQLRVGVNLGDVIEQDGTAFGDAVNVAARLQALAKPGGVLISGPVYDQVHLKVPARFVPAGMRQFKNIEEPVRTWEVLPADVSFGAGLRARLRSWRLRRAALLGAGLVAAVAIGLLWRELSAPITGGGPAALLGLPQAEPPTGSIAVLPFVNMSGDPANDYLGDGLAEELSHRLTKIPELQVAARTSTFAFKGKDLGADAIAQQLGVRYIVEGSVKRQSDRLRITAALVDGTSGASRWSNAYELQSSDFFEVERDIAAQVITALALVLGRKPAGQADGPRDGSVAAYDLYLQGLAYLRQPRSAKSLGAAETLFSQALAGQPDFARAQARLCETRVERYLLDKTPAQVAAAEEACANAEALDATAPELHLARGRLQLATGDAAAASAAYRRALELVPQSPDALVGLARALAAAGRQDQAAGMFQRAIAAQPSYAVAHDAYGNFLFGLGRAAEAAQAYERVTVLTPDNPTALASLGGAYLMLGDFDRAADAFSRSLALEPRRASYANIGSVHYYRGLYAEAAEMYRRAIEQSPADHRLWGNLADALLYGGRGDEATAGYRRALELVDGELAVNARHAQNQALAAYYATRLQDPERARRSLVTALAEGGEDVYVQYYAALARLGLGERSKALAHARRARDLGYPETLIRAAPELEDIRNQI